jgi:hypothetical protein
VHLLVEVGGDEAEPDLHGHAVLSGQGWCQGRWDGLLDLWWSRRERWRGRGRGARRRGLSGRGGGGEEAADGGARAASEGFDAVFERYGFFR